MHVCWYLKRFCEDFENIKITGKKKPPEGGEALQRVPIY